MRKRRDNSTRQVRCVTVLSHPNQHLAPAFKELHGRGEFEHVVIYGSARFEEIDPGFDLRIEWDVDLLEGYESRVVRLSSRRGGVLRGTWTTLSDLKPDVVIIHGWGKAIDRVSIGWCIWHRVPFLVTGDTSSHHQFARSRGVIALRRLLLRLLFVLASGALTTGAFNREFYRIHGMPPAKLFTGCIPIDTERFGRGELRARSAQPSVLFAGKLVDFKGCADLIRALAGLRELSWTLTVAGDGPEREHLVRLCNELKIERRVTFAGFVNQSAMPSLLAAADIVAVPSWKDNRVLVASEALASGAAVITSTGTGIWGPGDIIEHGVSGLVVEVGDIEALRDALRRLIEQPALRGQLASAGRQRVLESQSTSAFARFVTAAVIATAK